MFAPIPKTALMAGFVALHVLWCSSTWAARPTAAQALKLRPIQSGVDYDQPDEEQAAQCSLESVSQKGESGWVVRDPAGRLLRRFLDTNGNNKVDQWCYYKDGIEVYRDIDADFNGKADQYRWLGTSGIRWGVDQNENGQIDSWKVISAEEVTMEVVAALRDRDVQRFRRLLLTSSELKSLGLGPEQTEELAQKIAAAGSKFEQLAADQKVVGSQTQWIHFGATRPGTVPAGTGGSTRDVHVYDNVAAVIETDGKHGQVLIGALVRVGECWRLIDLPRNLGADQSDALAGGYFFQAPLPARPQQAEATESGLTAEVQKLISELERIDNALGDAPGLDRQAELHASRADIVEQLAQQASDDEERSMWTRQLADTVSAAVQAGGYPAGVERLGALLEELRQDSASSEQVPYVKFRYMTAQYGQSLQDPEADFAKIQTEWLENLEQFVEDYPDSPDAAEAMLQLAIAQEFSGQEEEAIRWYGRIVKDFPSHELSAKAEGANRRLQSVGRTIALRGKTLDGKTVDLASYRGRTVLVHYWATWCEPCKQDLQLLKELQTKYGKQGFSLIGVNLDHQPKVATDYLAMNPLSWPQLYDEGGLDSRLANELGILTLPTMILVDSQGKVLNRNIHSGELDAELGKQLRAEPVKK